MSKYHRFSRQIPPKARPWDVHPIWRGIGCLLMLVGPFVAFAAADMLVNLNIKRGWVDVPAEMSGPLNIPEIIPGLTRINHFYANLLVAAVLLLIGFGFMMILYSSVYYLMGPSRYGPLDSPPVRRRPRRPPRR